MELQESPRSPVSIKQFFWFFGIATAVKLLLIPSYHSTDLEVHRHWLAITHSLPLSQWYIDETSEWTLDYPPFFAYFERFLSAFAHLIDPQIVHLHHGLNYKANSAIYFQRISVIVSDLFLSYGVYKSTQTLASLKRNLILVLVIWSPGLLVVDHLHFQYNGFLFGWLLLSISCLAHGRDLMGGFLFAVLLCFKHLFAVAAPVYFVYLLRHYCRGGLVWGFARLSVMRAAVVAVFAAAYGPFVCHGQGTVSFLLGSKLLGFLYNVKGIAFLLRKVGFNIPAPVASFTGGLVGDASPFAILPRITPMVTFIMVLLALSPCLFKTWRDPRLSPCLFKTWRDPRPRLIARSVAYAYTCGFLFGWHVHEKALLHISIPLAIVAVESLEDAKHYFLLSVVSCYSLFPLLYEAQEYPIKVLLLLLHTILMWFCFSAQIPKNVGRRGLCRLIRRSLNLS